ncbi:hypothetical protein GCM10009740_02420 [Terrabacter terrae]|uniref:Uncharacterized protein n=1 Tax=Terrabacter terrae TaxID=318434 RepID=A0ABN2TSB5_9MICO
MSEACVIEVNSPPVNPRVALRALTPPRVAVMDVEVIVVALPLRSVILLSAPAAVNVETALVAWSDRVQPVVPVLVRVFLNPAGWCSRWCR